MLFSLFDLAVIVFVSLTFFTNKNESDFEFFVGASIAWPAALSLSIPILIIYLIGGGFRLVYNKINEFKDNKTNASKEKTVRIINLGREPRSPDDVFKDPPSFDEKVIFSDTFDKEAQEEGEEIVSASRSNTL